MTEIGFYRKPFYITSFSKTLKHNQTPAEKILREYLRAKKFCGLKFHRQKPLFVYRESESLRDRFFIADFYNHPARLIIEVDGSIHNKKDVRDYDQLREHLLRERGYKTIRFTNDMVKSDIGKVLACIKNNIIIS